MFVCVTLQGMLNRNGLRVTVFDKDDSERMKRIKATTKLFHDRSKCAVTAIVRVIQLLLGNITAY
jgi:hypothetical protein